MLKLLAALLIASGLFLPLASCHRYLGPQGQEVHYLDALGRPALPGPGAPEVRPVEAYVQAHPLPTGLRLQKDYKYFFSGAPWKDPFLWLGLLGLAWPLGWILTAGRAGARLRMGVDLGAPLLLLGTGFALVSRAAQGDHFEVGFWTTFAGILLYGLPAAAAWRQRLGTHHPGLPAFFRWAVVLLAFLLGPSLPLWQIVGHILS